jgi:hypothetical protein
MKEMHLCISVPIPDIYRNYIFVESNMYMYKHYKNMDTQERHAQLE